MERHCRQKPVRVTTFNFKITLREALPKKTWRQNIACIVLSRCVVNTQKNKEIITWLNGYILSIV